MPRTPETPRRVVIEQVQPTIDAGRYPIKRVPGEPIDVTADVFADGHDLIRAVVIWRALAHHEFDHRATSRVPWDVVDLTALPNDAWTATLEVEREGWIEYAVVAWIDHFGTWRRDLLKKHEARFDVTSELLEGAELLRRAARQPSTPRASAAWLRAQADALASTTDRAVRVAVATSTDLLEAMRDHAEHIAPVASPIHLVMVEPVRARLGAWYEFFPRSATPDPTRSARWDEAATRLDDIASMGFDVVYLPPIHPIGLTHRKGRNNALTASPGDPGSPWAIGSRAGGHTAVDPGLGTLDEFRRFVERARRLGIDVALDLAYQCSPDHPYVREHPEWFRHRPDGTIKYAENPPKKYQDIYPFDFESPQWQALWAELVRVITFWVESGVTIFRVDNPHTKPFRFWEWAMREVRRTYPGVIFLSEAFTRPKIMRHLAKIGFSQSYSYFTWRNTKAELTEYFTELTQTAVAEYMRPNLFANTPDILHEYLQHGGRPAFEARLVLAATLGASYGIYSGFELCENRPVRPGSEEYLDSEKYEIKPRDWDAPGSLRPLVTTINRIRREHPALHHDRTLRIHETDNDALFAYSKRSRDGRDTVLAVVNLDPVHMQHGFVQVPADTWGLDADGYWVNDLLTGERYFWRGASNYVRLDPGVRQAHILEVERGAGEG